MARIVLSDVTKKMGRGLLIDIDGTLLHEGRALPGAVEAVQRLRAAGVRLRFMTNTSARPPEQIAGKLRAAGFSVETSEVFSSVQAAALHLATRPDRKCLFLIDPAIRPALAAFTASEKDADTVVMGDMGEAITFRLLNQAFRRIRDGAELVVLQKNPFWFSADGPTLDCGAFAAALEFATGREALVVGKPNPLFFDLALASLDLPRGRVIVVGDDVTTDIAGAARAGLRSLLVRTGKFADAELARAPAPPTALLASIAEVPSWLEAVP